jgi:tetratricopeptide (TPR) repeat protein
MIYKTFSCLLHTLAIVLVFAACVSAQFPDRKTVMGVGGGTYILFGDLTVDESSQRRAKPLTYEVVLNNIGGTPAGRQYVSAGGRYQFNNLAAGQYELIVLLDHEEVGRMRVEILPVSAGMERVQQDIPLAWTGAAHSKPATVSVADSYKRTDANEKLFVKAQEATNQKRYDDAITTLKDLVTADPHDFQAWAELGTVYLFKQNYEESENAYVKSTIERPEFFLAQLNLGRLRSLRKNFEGAIDPLSAAVNIQPKSADANYLLGEAYLQIKKGSKAVGYLNEAIKIDPVGKADAHLRLATLYNAVGMKDKAALEYEEFLKVKPNYPDRKKLQDYIAANKK